MKTDPSDIPGSLRREVRGSVGSIHVVTNMHMDLQLLDMSAL